jgi:hypothetical protein
MASTPDGKGYWLAAADGGIFTFGDAAFYGSEGGTNLYAPIVAITPTPDGKGYWLAAADGGIFTFGDAAFYGSEGGATLKAPIVGMATTPDGKGYWLAAADGGIFTFGDAAFYGSEGGVALNAAVVGIASTSDGKGYWLAAADGGIFTFGDAAFYGSEGNTDLNASVVGMAVTPDQKGYWLVGNDGGVFTLGDAPFYGSDGGLSPVAPVAAIASIPNGTGYWLLAPDNVPVTFSTPSPNSTSPSSGRIVAAAASQIGPDPDNSEGPFCNPYGPCEEWCALFATWAWQQGGFPVPSLPFVGSIYNWAQTNGAIIPTTGTPAPGDAVLYGTGPQNVNTSVHTGIVAAVWPDGEIITIEGDAGPAPTGALNVVLNGPFLPKDSLAYNGVPVYAFAQP